MNSLKDYQTNNNFSRKNNELYFISCTRYDYNYDIIILQPHQNVVTRDLKTNFPCLR